MRSLDLRPDSQSQLKLPLARILTITTEGGIGEEDFSLRVGKSVTIQHCWISPANGNRSDQLL